MPLRHRLTALLLALVPLLCGGCVGSRATLPATGALRCAPRPPARSTVLGRELRRTRAPRLREAVVRARPMFLTRFGPRHDVRPVVYVDGIPAGSLEVLREIPVVDVESVTFMNPIEATTRFGTDHQAGALLVATRGSRTGTPCPAR